MLPSLVGLSLIGVVALAWIPNRHLAHFPVEACRESVALTRSVTNATHPDFGKDALTAGPGMTTEGYDPATLRIQSAVDLQALMAQSDRESRPLYLNFGFPSFLKETHPDVFEIIENPQYFEAVATLPGQFFASTRHVYRYLGAQSPTAP